MVLDCNPSLGLWPILTSFLPIATASVLRLQSLTRALAYSDLTSHFLIVASNVIAIPHSGSGLF